MNFNSLNKDHGILFAVGLIAGAVGTKVLKTEKVRKFTVNKIAQGMMIKDCANETIANLREEAEDICNEARSVAKNASDCDDLAE